jgi:hypothetical protein
LGRHVKKVTAPKSNQINAPMSTNTNTERGAMMRELRDIANEAVAKKQHDANVLASKDSEIMALYAEHIPKIKEGMRAAAANGEFRLYYQIDDYASRVRNIINVWFMQEPEWDTRFYVSNTLKVDYIKFDW